jgi:2-C-methyl-D-erythritol 4-phosphate cytidylyltransferase
MEGYEKKEYISLAGKPVLVHSIEKFLEPSTFDPIVVTVPKSQIEQVKKLIVKFISIGKLHFIEGGNTRQKSVHTALLALRSVSPDFVLIHDGARPWVSRSLIDRIAEGAFQHGACIPVIKPSDALKDLDNESFVVHHLSNHKIYGAQTPQGFAFKQILAAHNSALEHKVAAPDDAELYGMYAGRVLAITGEPENIKITYPHDIKRAQE